MSRQEFRQYGKETVDYIADYLETIHKRRVVPAIEPGYLKVIRGYAVLLASLIAVLLELDTARSSIKRGELGHGDG